ncbi:MAG TPA: TIR domain-containing protein [Anaerolineales bacterium]|nr:TIR domain-containing protein [Anaerolineales bacterium]
MNTARRRWTFISYSRKDKKFALQFARELKSAGHFVWLDQLDIPTGARWDDAVERALRECEIFLVILTAASISSENVKDEIGYAIDHGKRIMPVLLEECDIPLRLRRFQYVDFTTMKFEEGVKRAKQLLEDFLTDEPMQDPTKMLREAQETSRTEVATVSSLPPQKKSLPYRWMLAFTALLGALSVMLIFRNSIFPPTPTFVATAVPTSAGTSGTSLLPIVTLPGSDAITSAAFSPDGQTLATVSYSGAKLWRVSDGSLLRSITTEAGKAVAFSPDNQILATGLGSTTVKLWRVSDGSRLRTLEGLTSDVYSVAFSPDGQIVAAGGFNEGVKLWQANDGTLLHDLPGHTSHVYSVVFSPDGQMLASASSDYTVKLWRVSDGMLLYELQGFNPVAFSPDGQTVATGGYNNVVQLFRVSDGALLGRLPGHSSSVASAAFSPDGQTLVTGSKDIEVRRWHVSDGVRLYTWEENGEGVSFVTFSTDGRMMAAVYKDGTVKLWQVP